MVAGLEAAETFLARREPTFVVGRWIDANLPSDARLIGQDHRGFYLPRPYAMELAHRRRTGLGSRGESAEAIIQELRGDGFTHLLLCPPEPEDAIEFGPPPSGGCWHPGSALIPRSTASASATVTVWSAAMKSMIWPRGIRADGLA